MMCRPSSCLLSFLLLAGCSEKPVELEETKLGIETRTLPAARVGEPYTATLEASGGAPPYRWSLEGGSLPQGLALQADRLTGSPDEAGRFGLMLLVTDSEDATARGSASLQIDPSDPAPMPDSRCDSPIQLA